MAKRKDSIKAEDMDVIGIKFNVRSSGGYASGRKGVRHPSDGRRVGRCG